MRDSKNRLICNICHKIRKLGQKYKEKKGITLEIKSEQK